MPSDCVVPYAPECNTEDATFDWIKSFVFASEEYAVVDGVKVVPDGYLALLESLNWSKNQCVELPVPFPIVMFPE